jgi:hypothetical protein
MTEVCPVGCTVDYRGMLHGPVSEFAAFLDRYSGRAAMSIWSWQHLNAAEWALLAERANAPMVPPDDQPVHIAPPHRRSRRTTAGRGRVSEPGPLLDRGHASDECRPVGSSYISYQAAAWPRNGTRALGVRSVTNRRNGEFRLTLEVSLVSCGGRWPRG